MAKNALNVGFSATGKIKRSDFGGACRTDGANAGTGPLGRGIHCRR